MKRFKKLTAALLTLCVCTFSAVPSFAASRQFVQSDTTENFTMPKGQAYSFKFTVHGTHANPQIKAGNGSVLRTENVQKSTVEGEDVYFFKVRAVGAMGASSAVYTTMPGEEAVRHCTITIDTKYVQSDTTTNFSVKQGKTYSFKLSVFGTHENPQIAAGNSSVLRTESTRKCTENGHDVYYFKVRAVGAPGSSSAVYTTLSGRKAVKHCIITVAPAGTYHGDYARAVVNEVNSQRRKAGLPALNWNSQLAKTAELRAEESSRSFSHTRPNGQSCFTAYPSYCSNVGENLAFTTRLSYKDVMEMWMQSAGHKANILRSSFGQIGVGCYEKDGCIYWTQSFSN